MVGSNRFPMIPNDGGCYEKITEMDRAHPARRGLAWQLCWNERNRGMKMNRINRIAVAVFGIVALVVFLIGASLLGSWGYCGWGMMGPGMMGGWGFAPFGWIGMIFMWLIPIGLIALTVLGVVWLARAVGGGTTLGSP